MSRNLISNGNFETGNFDHWVVKERDGKARVVQRDGSYRAEFTLAPIQGQKDPQIETTFDVPPGKFTIFVEAYAPKSLIPEHANIRPYVFYNVTATIGDTFPPVLIFIYGEPLTKSPKVFTINHCIEADVDRVKVSVSITPRLYIFNPDDPTPIPSPELAGPIYIDSVKYYSHV